MLCNPRNDRNANGISKAEKGLVWWNIQLIFIGTHQARRLAWSDEASIAFALTGFQKDLPTATAAWCSQATRNTISA